MDNQKTMLMEITDNILGALPETTTLAIFEDENGVTTILVTDSEDENSKMIWTGKFAELMLEQVSVLFDSGLFDEAENNESEEES